MDSQLTEPEIVERAVEILRGKLPPSLEAELVDRSGPAGADLTLTIRSQPTSALASVLVEVKRGFRPADIDALLGGLGRRLRTVAGTGTSILVVSDYLSPRSRELLALENIGYIDLAGNMRLVLDHPAVWVETIGTDRRSTTSPSPSTLRGAKAGRLARFLADVRPPYGVVEIAAATILSRGYVSRLVELLADEALIEREPRGPITGVDWKALLRRRAQAVDLLKTNTAFSFIAPNGARATLGILRDRDDLEVVVTGSFAAYRFAPVAAPALLALYTKRPSATVQEALELLPAQEGGDVVVLRPSNDIALELVDETDGIRYAALSQVALDCLSGPGRMPSEGDALMEWMDANEQHWRKPDIDAYLRALQQLASHG